jgi:hypothetical protein
VTSTIRTVAAYVVAAAALWFGLQPLFLKLPFTGREELRAIFTGFPDRTAPQYPSFLEEVREATPPGAPVALVVPMRRWDEGYSYAYYRASYFLAGRHVLPIVGDRDQLIPESIDRALYIAAWRTQIRTAGFEPVWERDEGMLYVRSK